MSDENINIATAYNEAVALLSQEGAGSAQWGEAISKLLKIKSSGQSSSALEANLGRAYFKLENYPKAIEHFELAIRFDRFNSQYREDLALAQSKNPGQLATKIEHPAEWAAWTNSFVRPEEGLFGLSFFLLLFLAYPLLVKPYKKIVWGIVPLLFVVAFAFSIFSYSGNSIAIVTSPADASIKSAPLDSAEEIMIIKPGSRLRILSESGSFTEVERPNVFRGWVASDKIQRIKNLK